MSNTITSEKIVITTTPTGHEKSINVISVTGTKTGPHVYIQSSVHGSELQGNLVIHNLLEYLKKYDINGSMTIVPLANPMATDNKVSTFTQGRFHPETGENWNRLYQDISHDLNLEEIINAKDIKQTAKKAIQSALTKAYNKGSEYGHKSSSLLAYQLQSLASKADIVLDLHTGPVATDYIYARKDKKEKSRDLNFPHTILITNLFAGAMDEASFMPWHTIEKHIEKVHHKTEDLFEVYTIELGSEEYISSQRAENQTNNILSFLSKRSVIKETIKVQDCEPFESDLENFVSYNTPKGGLVEYLKTPGQKVVKGEPLYKLYLQNDLGFTEENVLALESGVVINHAPSSALSKGTCVYQVLNRKS